MKASFVNGTCCCAFAWLLLATPVRGLDIRDLRGEWRVEWYKNEPKTSDRLQTPGTTLSPWQVAGSLLGEIQGEWHPRLRYYFRGEATLRENGRQPAARFRLIEGALQFEITPLVFLDIGKVLETWGSGYAFNPVNVLLPPEDPAESHANQPGVTLLKLEILGERSTFSAILAGVGDEKTSGRVFVLPDSEKKRRIAFKWDHTIGDFDLSWIHVQGGIEGKSLRDSLEGSPLAPQTLPATSGLAWNTVLGESLEIHGEYALQRGRGHPVPAMSELPRNAEVETGGNSPFFVYRNDHSGKNRLFSRFLSGAQFTFSNGFNLAAEWLFHEPGYSRQEWRLIRQGIQTSYRSQKENSTRIVGSDPHSGFLSQTQLLLKRNPFRQNYIFLRLISNRLASNYESESIALFNLDDSSFLFREKLSQFRGDHWTLSLEWTTFQGPTFSEFGLNPYRNQLNLAISCLF